MYRPSDEEIAAASQVLKDWKMPSGWHTAAVLALDAAAKARAPKKMEKRTDDEMVKFLDGVVCIIEANTNEYVYIWEQNKEHVGYNWIEINSGILEYVGFLDDRPICISLRKAIINGDLILFWYATSQVIDYKMIDEWFALNLPNIPKTDSTNWVNAFRR